MGPVGPTPGERTVGTHECGTQWAHHTCGSDALLTPAVPLLQDLTMVSGQPHAWNWIILPIS